MAKFIFPEHATPPDDISGLRLPWIQNLKDLNRVETENISKAQKKYLENTVKKPIHWFSLPLLKKIHFDMFGDVWDWAGKWRVSITNIGIKPRLIPCRLSELSVQVLSWSSDCHHLSVLERSARIHQSLAHIHPFENGNGRFARLVADRYLLAYKCIHPVWPYQIEKKGSVRGKYINALKAADRGNYQPLISLMIQFQAKEALQ